MPTFLSIRADCKRDLDRILQVQVFFSHFLQYLDIQICVCKRLFGKNNRLAGTELDGKGGLGIDSQPFLNSEFQDDLSLLASGQAFGTHGPLDPQDVVFLSKGGKRNAKYEQKKKNTSLQSRSSVVYRSSCILLSLYARVNKICLYFYFFIYYNRLQTPWIQNRSSREPATSSLPRW